MNLKSTREMGQDRNSKHNCGQHRLARKEQCTEAQVCAVRGPCDERERLKEMCQYEFLPFPTRSVMR